MFIFFVKFTLHIEVGALENIFMALENRNRLLDYIIYTLENKFKSLDSKLITLDNSIITLQMRDIKIKNKNNKTERT